MLCTTQGIVLHTVKYADKKIISKIYTKEHGIVSVNAFISSSSKSKISTSLTQPLSLVEIQVLLKENSDIHALKEIRATHHYLSLHENFYKLCVAQFLNEILNKCLKEQQANEELFEFIMKTFVWLDKTESGYNSIPVFFLFGLTKHLGFYPLNNIDEKCCFFDLMEGKFQPFKLEFPLGINEIDSILFGSLFEFNLTSENIYTKHQRDTLLEILLLYYKYHLPGFNNLKSYQVLKETLHT
jgi:DNA repair protein RecO (recombination protein O)